VDEGRKRVLLIAASILAARKLCQIEDIERRSPKYEAIISDAITNAERIMQRIDGKYPERKSR
jgi:hypothetical protein